MAAGRLTGDLHYTLAEGQYIAILRSKIISHCIAIYRIYEVNISQNRRYKFLTEFAIFPCGKRYVPVARDMSPKGRRVSPLRRQVVREAGPYKCLVGTDSDGVYCKMSASAAAGIWVCVLFERIFAKK